MKITVLCVGRIKEKFYSDAVAEYLKRLSRYAKTEVIEVADEKTPDGASERETALILEKEGARLLKYISDDAYVIALAVGGKEYTSPEFAEKILSSYDVSPFVLEPLDPDNAAVIDIELPYEVSDSTKVEGASTALIED